MASAATSDVARLRHWVDGVGLAARIVAGPSAEELWITPRDQAGPLVVVTQRDAQTREIVHERRLAARALSSEWSAPRDDEPPGAVVSPAARDLACGFPLVDATIDADGDDMTIRFTAPVFDDDLARQTFLLTMSSVLKATQLFGIVAVRRAEELSEWERFEASSERSRQEQQELIDRMTRPSTGPPPGLPASNAR